MPTMWERRDDAETVYLGLFDRVTANKVAEGLEQAQIVWWYKEPGIISVVWEFGVSLFVDKERLGEAQAILERVRAELAADPTGGEGA